MKMSKEERQAQGLKVSELRNKGMLYRAIDYIEMTYEVLGYASSKRELNLFFNERVNDTDGECYLIAQKWNDESNFYFRTMPTLSAKRCKEILNVLYPHFKAESQTFVFEWVDSGYTGVQELNRKGTILNF